MCRIGVRKVHRKYIHALPRPLASPAGVCGKNTHSGHPYREPYRELDRDWNRKSVRYLQLSGDITPPGWHWEATGQTPHGVRLKPLVPSALSYIFARYIEFCSTANPSKTKESRSCLASSGESWNLTKFRELSHLAVASALTELNRYASITDAVFWLASSLSDCKCCFNKCVLF